MGRDHEGCDHGGDMTDELVLVQERRGAILVLRLNRPEVRNVLNGDLLAQLGAALRAAEEDPEVRCVVLTGTGDRAFCSGLDLADFAAAGTATMPGAEALADLRRFLDGDVDIPIVAAVNADRGGRRVRGAARL